MIRVEHVSKSFGSKQVLQDINLELHPGVIYGIVGVNGAGKTTLFNCLSGIEEYVGKIVSDIEDFKNKTGVLQTNPFFFDKLTGREYLQLICHARNIAAINFEEKNIFNLPLDEFASLYSTGMKKKLALMGILIQKNDFFILDEPFNGVDIQSNIIITEIIKRLRSNGKTTIISSHIFSTLREVCDKIYVLENMSIQKEVEQDQFEALEEEIKESTVMKDIDLLF